MSSLLEPNEFDLIIKNKPPVISLFVSSLLEPNEFDLIIKNMSNSLGDKKAVFTHLTVVGNHSIKLFTE